MAKIEYRKLLNGNEQISTIGMGLANLYEYPDEQIREAISYAVENGINYYDAVCGDIRTYQIFGECIRGKRDRIYTQMHLGACYEEDKYGFSRDLELIKRSIQKVFSAVGTAYTDFLFIHCVDEAEDFDKIVRNGLLDYAIQLKEEGAARHLGFSTHTPAIARRFLEMGIMDMFMFSINPAYDYRQGELAYGGLDEREDLYRFALKKKAGISVMKPFSGGILLDGKRSPLGVALNHAQCLQYALDRPAVITCLPGCVTKDEVKAVLSYYDSSKEERDYSVISSATPQEIMGRCVYCNHCAPCPAGIDVGLVNKYYDLSKAGDELAASHYAKLSLRADACIGCGHCDSRCPFGVRQRERMQEIASYFSGRK